MPVEWKPPPAPTFDVEWAEKTTIYHKDGAGVVAAPDEKIGRIVRWHRMFLETAFEAEMLLSSKEKMPLKVRVDPTMPLRWSLWKLRGTCYPHLQPRDRRLTPFDPQETFSGPRLIRIGAGYTPEAAS